MKDCCVFWGKISTNLENNIEYDKQAFHNNINNFEADIVHRDEVMPLRDNMPQIADKTLLYQGVATRNKKLVAIISFYVLSYSCNKKTNLF